MKLGEAIYEICKCRSQQLDQERIRNGRDSMEYWEARYEKDRAQAHAEYPWISQLLHLGWYTTDILDGISVEELKNLYVRRDYCPNDEWKSYELWQCAVRQLELRGYPVICRECLGYSSPVELWMYEENIPCQSCGEILD
jgi:hypothetical protein